MFKHGSIVIRINYLSGEQLTILATNSWTASDLKDAIEDKTRILVAAQSLQLGIRELCGSECLGDLATGDVIEMSLVVSWNRAIFDSDYCDVLCCLEMAPFEIRSNREIILEAVRRNGLALQFAALELRADREIVLAAVQDCGYALQHAHQALKDDALVVRAAICQTGRRHVLDHASARLQRLLAPPPIVPFW